eukprot:jgi/Bigna1/33752/e_gw1.3.335.1
MTPSDVPLRSVKVHVTNNWHDYSKTYQLYQYRYEVNVTKVFVTRGTVEGGTKVFVYGNHFTHDPLLRCKFGNLEVNATYMNSTQLYCHTPAQTAGTYTVEISTNG